jgi:hypothetical protein
VLDPVTALLEEAPPLPPVLEAGDPPWMSKMPLQAEAAISAGTRKVKGAAWGRMAASG